MTKAATMKVSDLKEFISIWGLAAIDDGSDVLTFTKPEDYTVSFAGMHVGARRVQNQNQDIDIEGLTDKPVSVQGAMLHGALALMDDTASLTAELSGTSLRLKAGARTATVRTVDRGGEFVLPPLTVESQVEIDSADLGPKLDMLAGVAARTLDKPALTGINVSTGSAGLVMRATDGHGRACMVTQAVRSQDGDMSFTSPAADLGLALRECDRTAFLKQGGSMLHISDGETFIRMSLIQGEYPTFRNLPRNFTSKLVIPSSTIDVAVRAANLMSQHGLVTLTSRDDKLRLMVMDEEKGNFDEELGPTLEPEFTLHFDAEYLSQVAKASGIETVLQRTPDNPNSVLVSGTGWYFWLNAIVMN